MFQHTSLLNVVLSAVLTVVVGTEYYSGYPSVANKHFYEYGSQTNDTIDDDVDDIEVQVTLTHSAVLFGVPYTEFSLNPNGFLRFGTNSTVCYGIAIIPKSGFNGSSLLLPYSLDLSVRTLSDASLNYRVDRSEHTLLRATADVIDRFPSDTTFQAAEVFVCTWHRTSVFAPDEANRATVQVVVISNGVSTSYVIYNYGDEMTAYKTNHMVGVGIQHRNISSNFHYQYTYPSNWSVDPLQGQRLMFKVEEPLVMPQSEANEECVSETWSHNYRDPCDTCPPGWYQEEGGQMFCRNCQDLMEEAEFVTNRKRSRRQTVSRQKRQLTTDDVVMTLPQNCLLDTTTDPPSSCTPGTFSASGYGPGCTPCSLGSYQAGSGQTSCVVCGNGQTTANVGATSSDQCYSTSTVVGDPHFMITDPKSKEHFCFDYGGDDGENLILVDDAQTAISVSGSLFEVTPSSHQTYFSTIQIKSMYRAVNFNKTAIMVEEEMLSWSLDSVVVFDGLVVRPLVERVDAVLVELMGGDVSAVVTRHHDQIGYFLGVYLVETNGLSKHTKGLLGQFVHHEWSVSTRHGSSTVTVQLESGDVTVPVKQVPRFSPTSHSRLMCWLYESESDATNLLFQRAELDAWRPFDAQGDLDVHAELDARAELETHAN